MHVGKVTGCHAGCQESAGVALEENLRLPTVALKPRGDITRSLKQGYQLSHKTDMCPTKILIKKDSVMGCVPIFRECVD